MVSVFDVLRELARLSEWTGLSAGMIAGCAALAWFIPTLRTLAIATAITVAAAYGGTLYGNYVGRADVTREWDKANAAAAAIAKAHDQAIAASIHAQYMPQLAALQKQSDQYQQQVKEYERTILGQKSKAAASCLLGASALRLRGHK